MEQEGGEEGKKRGRMEELKRVWKNDGGKDNGNKIRKRGSKNGKKEEGRKTRKEGSFKEEDGGSEEEKEKKT